MENDIELGGAGMADFADMAPLRRRNYSLGARLISILKDNEIGASSFAIVRYLLENFRRISEIGIEEIMEVCYVSRSGVRRFYRSIGFENLSDARSYADEYVRMKRLYRGYAADAGYGANLADQLGDVFDNVQHACDEGVADVLARLIHSADNVLAIASGMSGAALYDLQMGLCATDKIILIATDAGDFEEPIGSLSESDLLITLSVTGYFAAHNAARIRACRAATVLITTSDEAVLNDAFDHVYRIGPFVGMKHRSLYSKYATAFFLDQVFMRYVELFDNPPAKEAGEEAGKDA